MSTCSDLILRGLVMSGEKSLGATLSATEETAWLAVMNSMLDSWSLPPSLMVYQLLEESLALTAGTGSYTIGSGGDFNTTRPIKLTNPCYLLDASNNKYGLKLLDAVQYGRTNPLTSGNSIPTALFYDSADVAGLGTLYLYPYPSSGYTLYINSWKQLTQFATVGETVVLPPGYEEAITSNFAIRSVAGNRAIPATVVEIARTSKAAIKRVNAPTGVLTMPVGLVTSQRRNIEAGP